MTRRIYTIPPDAAFIDRLAEGLWRQAEEDLFKLSRMHVLLPTRRACRALREAFPRITKARAALLPVMRPIGDLDEKELYFSGEDTNLDIPPAISPLRRQLLLARLICAKDSDMPIDQAAQLAAALGTFLDEVQITRRDFADLHKLVPENLAAHWQQTIEFLKIITEAWPKALAEEGAIDPAARRNRVIEAQAENWRNNPPDFPVIAAGSTGSMPATADLLAVIASLPQGAVILPGLDTELDEEAWQAIDETHPQFSMKQWLETCGAKRAEVQPWPLSRTAGEGGAHSRASASEWEGEGQVNAPLILPRRAERGTLSRNAGEGRVRLLQESMRPAEVTEAWRELDAKKIPRAALNGLTHLTLDNAQEEAQAIALMMRGALETQSKTAALVTADCNLAERVAAQLARWGIAANDSAGASLAALPPGSFLLDALAAASPSATPVDYLSLLKHPLAGCGLDPALCRARARQIEIEVWRNPNLEDRSLPLEGGVRGGGDPQRPTSVFRHAPPPNLPLEGGGIRAAPADDARLWLIELKLKFQPASKSWRKNLPLAERLRTHRELAETLAASDKEKGAVRLWRGEAGEAAARWLDEWQQAAHGFPPLNGDDYFALFAGFLRAVTVRPAYGQHPRLSILGPLEARLVQADLTILGGLNEGSWPPEAAIDPWMSRPMKRDFGLPLPERRIGLSAHDFVQLASGPEVVLTRARRAGNAPTVPSRFLLQLETVLRALGYGDALTPPEPWADWARSLDEPAAIHACEAPAPRPPAVARPRRLHVTEIGTWRRNPYAIYARHILRLQKLEPLEKDAAATDKGLIIHKALEIFMHRYPDRLPPQALEELLKIGRGVFEPYKEWPQVMSFWWPRFERIAAWFIAHEEERRAAGIKNLKAEARGSITLNGNFTLEGRADRIDRLPDGALEIVDYKTGGVPTQTDVRAGFEPQLPLLALIAAEGGFKDIPATPASTLAYWKLSGGAEPGEEQTLNFPIEAAMKNARAGLENLIARFADPQTPYEAVPKPNLQPRYDDYAHLARLAEWGRTAEDT